MLLFQATFLPTDHVTMCVVVTAVCRGCWLWNGDQMQRRSNIEPVWQVLIEQSRSQRSDSLVKTSMWVYSCFFLNVTCS